MKGMTSMIDQLLQNLSGRARSATLLFAVLAMGTNGAYPGLAQQSPQPTFPSAAEAGQSLFQAVQSNNEKAIANILRATTELTSSHDEGQDKLDRQLFVQKYEEMHRFGHNADGPLTLYIGAENWPFPIPVVKKDGAWRFDSDAGSKEVLYRRVGENELTAIAICHDFVAAAKRGQMKPNSLNPEDGPATRLVATAATESSSGDPLLFDGYYFRRLPSSGGKAKAGLAMIAYPAEYRSSGVMTFIVTDNDVVYEKDLGASTSALATAMAAFHKDATWRPTDD
jgi:hypothetical protein